jgi:hypothetical protein
LFWLDAADKERAPDIRVVSAQDGTKLRFRGCSSRFQPRGTRSRWAVGPKLASDDSNVQAAMDASPTAPLEDAELVRDGAGWAYSPFDRFSGSLPALADPVIEDCSPTDLFPGDHPAGTTYYYTLAAYRSFADKAAHSQRAAEASVAITKAGTAVALRVALGRARAAVRVWRGPSSGVYESYADVTIGAYSTMLVDTGRFLCGSAWTAQSVPTPPRENNTR